MHDPVITDPLGARPALSRALSEQEFRRWYWLLDELRPFARALGIASSGSKELLSDRIAATLAGRAHAEPADRAPAVSAQLREPVTAETVIPVGQRCSQVVRRWFTAQVGPAFRFDRPLRHFFAEADGTRTLGDALDFWRATRQEQPGVIDRQFEYNRFTRAWHASHPGGSREALLADWRAYRAAPVDARGRI